jgi:hypothetical protein
MREAGARGTPVGLELVGGAPCGDATASLNGMAGEGSV